MKQWYTYFNNKKLVTMIKMLFQLFFYAAEQWHPVAIPAKVLATKITQAQIFMQRKMKRKRN